MGDEYFHNQDHSYLTLQQNYFVQKGKFMENFKALLVSDKDGEIGYNIENDLTVDDLSNGEVLIKIHYSSVNYKDMLAVQKNGGCHSRLSYDTWY